MELQVRHLRVICSIARAGSLNRAAVALGLAQPALSHQLRRIERLIGGKLFDRDQQGARPTELGMLVLSRARAIVQAFDELERDFCRPATTASAVSTQAVRVGWNHSALVPDLLGALRAILPSVAVRTRADESRNRLLVQVANHSIDGALVMLCGRRRLALPPGVRATTIVDEPAFVALPATHPLASRDEIDLADLEEASWIFSSCGDGCLVVFREACQAHGFSPNIAHDVVSSHVCVELISGGYGISLVQPTRNELPGVVIRPFEKSPVMVRHFLVWREEGPLKDYAEQLSKDTLQAYWAMVRGNPRYRRWMCEHRGEDMKLVVNEG
jgi:DNA-binding transcriptional LysR family regulator